ncbi:hypothetical protein HDC34_001069 [Pseudoclavibacter sp. JAI123]|uniref:hypothetical protein n=1 Tax=Pseudoclavibacter sp. JAI123 TaxID=2723065 RepID=UPI0015CD19B2|nr:hypothetical protein [Pseudoclavibacter sp. JAI123]NYF12775.1 hypothetical protein [Pseudoclavibacter sp. JAI123]
MTSATPQDRRINRRTIIRGAAWSAPVIAVAAAAPSAAASPREFRIAPLSDFAATRCVATSAGTARFRVTLRGAAAPVGTPVALQLPAGLTFTAGGTTANVTTVADGVVNVPAFTVTGPAGSYAITGTVNAQVSPAQVFGDVNPSPGTVTELRRSVGPATTAPTFSTVAMTGITTATLGAISGDQAATGTVSTGSNAAVIVSPGGSVQIWGNNSGTQAPAHSILAVGGTNVSGVRFVDSWTSVQTANAGAGGVAAGATGAAVYQWYRNGTGAGPLTTTPVTGISGNVIDAQSNDGYSYVLTSTGLYWWANTGATAAATLIAGTAGATQFSSYAVRETAYTFGGAVLMANGSVQTWSTAAHTLTPRAGFPASIRSIEAGPSAVFALTNDGGLYSSGGAFSSSTGGANWTQRATGVSAFSTWSVSNYSGGSYINATGAVTQFFAASASGIAYTTAARALASGVQAVKVFASDGTYLALGSDRRVYAWGGNLDSGGATLPAAVTGISNAIDLNVWGYHQPSGSFYGGGYIITSTTC